MSDDLRVAVFCGFHGLDDSTNGGSEKDFAFRLLEIFATGQLQAAHLTDGIGSAITSVSPLFGQFYLSRQLEDGGPIQAAKLLVESCDFGIVILPYRPTGHKQSALKDGTSIYALMEYAYACGAGLPVLLVAEHPLGPESLGFAGELHRWPSHLDRKSIKKKEQWNILQQDFQNAVNKFRLRKSIATGFPKCRVDEFYRDHLIPLVMDWHEVRIYNHSVLPLSSSFNPPALAESANFLEDFNGVQKYHLNQPHRMLYFELEEALLTSSLARILHMVSLLPENTFTPQLIERIRRRFTSDSLKEAFSIRRFASLIPDEAYQILTDVEDQTRATMRDFSLLLQLYRLHQWQCDNLRVNYRLFGFRTYYPYSMPTTVYAERELVNGKAEKTAGIWGFLRSGGSLDPGKDDDAFIIGRNCKAVEVWERHLREVEPKDGIEPTPLFLPGSGAEFGVFFRLIGPEMRERIRGQIERRNWQNVLDVTGV